jgi:hypothetical protein
VLSIFGEVPKQKIATDPKESRTPAEEFYSVAAYGNATKKTGVLENPAAPLHGRFRGSETAGLFC